MTRTASLAPSMRLSSFLPAFLRRFLRRFRSAAQVEQAIAEALWLFARQDADVEATFQIVSLGGGAFAAWLAPGVSYRAVLRGSGQLLSEQEAEVLVRTRLILAFKERGAIFMGRPVDPQPGSLGQS